MANNLSHSRTGTDATEASAASRNRIYVIGAGSTGMAIAREIQHKGVLGSVVAFLDDDPAKIGNRVPGLPVLGPIADVIDLLRQTPADEAIIAMPRGTPAQINRIYQLLRRAGFGRIRIVPGIAQVLEEEPHLVQTREIDPEDLLSRTPVEVNLKETLRYVRGKRVVVTGAGGSIGAELSRQLLSGGPERLYLFGHGEASISEIERELAMLQQAGVGEAVSVVPVIGELQDRDFMHFIMSRVRADVVFHAAAHKHVPLMEANPIEAVKNNVYGTQNVVDASRESGVQRFVLISTDKAVEPVCVYGASKLIAEEIVLHEAAAALADGGGAQFLVVRFGNVLGSSGSFMPLFRKQILSGGPVTVTDRNVRRYLMTIPEAVSLVLKAGGSGRGGELYLLDMGEPKLIRDVAEEMIRFYGFEPHRDISIEFTQLRAGDKLVERLWGHGDITERTENEKVLRVTRAYSMNGDLARVLEQLHPVCFLDPEQHQAYRNRKVLKRVLNEAIPTIDSVDGEPDY
jgi:FlaA1/EpsC-like NDP-sugar epimerase